MEYGAGDTPREAAAALQSRAGVRFAEPNFAVSSTAVPNDPDFDLVWPYHTESTPGAPRRAGDLRAEDAWALASGAGVRVAVVDTGVDPRSLDLEPGVLHNPADPANGVDDDGNGLDRRHPRLGLRRRPAERRTTAATARTWPASSARDPTTASW